MRVLVAMSGGVDSSVAAALCLEAGHEVVGATMKLWGGPTDSGCCSVADVEDARRVAQQLGIVHHVFNFTEDFEASVVTPYVDDHLGGRTPNPCVACNRHLKFDRFLRRARQLGFDAIATGHHARIRYDPATGRHRLHRGADPTKDQSYVLYMLGQEHLAACLFPVGERTKSEVRAIAARLGLRTATKPDSQEVCFVGSATGRADFLRRRGELHPGRVVTTDGREVGRVPAVELVTVGQRRGLGVAVDGRRRYAVRVDVAARTVVVGDEDELRCGSLRVSGLCWVDRPVTGPVLVQVSAHGEVRPATLGADGTVVWSRPERRVAPGQAVVFYRGDEVLGGGVAA
jgi:tRNA-specific 2-thiouridylase